MPNELPLAAASVRLRRKPGRPRKPQSASVAGVPHPGTPRRNSSNSGAEASQTSAPPARPRSMRVPDGAVPELCPRLLDLGATAAYLGVPPDPMDEGRTQTEGRTQADVDSGNFSNDDSSRESVRQRPPRLMRPTRKTCPTG